LKKLYFHSSHIERSLSYKCNCRGKTDLERVTLEIVTVELYYIQICWHFVVYKVKHGNQELCM